MATPPDRAASVVLSKDGATILVIRRQRNGRHYCVVPGGGVETGESAEDAALRELSEETGLSGRIVRRLWTIQHQDRVAHYYLVDVDSGPVHLAGPELEQQSPTNQHRPEWIPLDAVEMSNLQPEELRPLLADLGQDWGRG